MRNALVKSDIAVVFAAHVCWLHQFLRSTLKGRSSTLSNFFAAFFVENILQVALFCLV